MTIGHKAGHYSHFRILRNANSDSCRIFFLGGGDFFFFLFWNLLGILLITNTLPRSCTVYTNRRVSWGPKDVTRLQQQGSPLSTVTLVWHASKYNVMILHLVTSFERCITPALIPYTRSRPRSVSDHAL